MLGYLCTHNHILTFSLSFTFSPIIRRNSWRMWCLATCAPTPSTSSSTFSTGCTDTITRWPWWGRNLIYLISYMTIGGWRKWLDWHLLEISFYKKKKIQKWYRFDWISGFSDHAFFEQKRTPNFAKVKGQGSRKKLLWRNHSAKVILLVQIFCAVSLHWCSWEGENEIKGVKGVVCPLNHCTRQKIHQQIKYERMVPWISHQEQVSKNQKPEVFQIKL